MTYEALGAAVSVATLVVIGATAFAAVAQIRQLRASNQLSGLISMLEQWNTPQIRDAYTHFHQAMPGNMTDPAYREMVVNGPRDRGKYPEFLVLDLWEQLGTFVKHDLLGEKVVLDISAMQIVSAWKRAQPIVTAMREREGPTVYQNFEYLAARATLFQRADGGAYPKDTPRMAAFDEATAP